MNLIEVILWIFVLAFVFIFWSYIFALSRLQIDIFWDFLKTHTKQISLISEFEINSSNCYEKEFTWLFLSNSLTWYFCSSWWFFNRYLK